jgi:hypothetical protein
VSGLGARGLGLAEALKIAAQIADALDAAHERRRASDESGVHARKDVEDGRSRRRDTPCFRRCHCLVAAGPHAGSGPVLNICSVQTNLGATWSKDNVIVLAPVNQTVLHRVNASGGTPEPLTTLNAGRKENSHRWPHFLPDGRHFLFTARSDVKENNLIYVGSLDSKDVKPLLAAQSNAVPLFRMRRSRPVTNDRATDGPVVRRGGRRRPIPDAVRRPRINAVVDPGRGGLERVAQVIMLTA